MSRSFFAGTDANLASSSMHFSGMINQSPEAYGLSQEECEAYAILNANYVAAYYLAVAPATRTRGTVIAKRDAREALCKAASDLAKIIAARRNVSNSQKLNLGLNVRAKGSPLARPGQPTDIRVELSSIGSLTLSWKCSSPRRGAGVIYLISRRIGSVGEFTHIGRSGKRKFEDVTLPMGQSQVTYRVQAVRGSSSGDFGEFNVNFGVDPGMQKMLRAAA